MNVVELSVSGNDKQETRSGYNKIKIIRANETKNGITFTNNGDGSCTLNGTNNTTGAIYFNLNLDSNNAEYFTLTKNKKYYMYLKGLKTGTRLMARSRNEQNFSLILSDEISKITEWTKETATDGIVYIEVSPGTTFNNETFYPMLAESETELPYEPYGAMPSPEFQSEVDTVGSNINMLETNLFPTTKLNGIDFKNNEDGTYILNGTATQNAFYTKQVTLKAGEYTLSGCPEGGAQDKYALQALGYGEGDFGKGQTFTLIEETIVPIRIMVWNGITVDNLIFKPKLEKGKVASKFSNYNVGCSSVIIENEDKTEQQTKVVDIQQEMLEGDYFIKEADGWKEVHTWNKQVLDGTEAGWNISGTDTSGINRFSNKIISNLVKKVLSSSEVGLLICDKFIAISANQSYNKIEGICINSSGTLYIFYNYCSSMTVEEFKNWLSQNNLTLYYKLETPLKLVCTETQNKQLDDLLNTSTYKNITHIYSTDKVSPVIKVKYRKDIETMLNNQQSEYETRLSNIEKLLSTTTTSSTLLDNLQKDIESEVI